MHDMPRAVGRRKTDAELHELLDDRQRLVAEHLTIARRRARHAREQTWLMRVLIVAVFALAAVTTYGLGVLYPQIRATQDANVCAYRAVANREGRLAQRAHGAARNAHRSSAETFRALERASANGRTVRCKSLLQRGRR